MTSGLKSTLQSTWLHLLVTFACGFGLHALLHTCPEPEASSSYSRTSESSIALHSEKQKDSNAFGVNVRAIDVTTPAATLKHSHGDAVTTTVCPLWKLSVLVPWTDTLGFDILTIDSIDCSAQTTGSVRITHSRKIAHAYDTTRFTQIITIYKDSTIYHYSHDSASSQTYKLTTLFEAGFGLSTSIFREGRAQLDPLETMAAFTARWYPGERVSLALRPELPIVRPALSQYLSDAVVRLDAFYYPFRANHNQ